MDGAYCLLKHLVRHALPGTGIDSQLVLRVYGSEKNVTDPCHMLRLKLLFQPYVVAVLKLQLQVIRSVLFPVYNTFLIIKRLQEYFYFNGNLLKVGKIMV